jgi:SCP-2 sterol transfer family
VPRFLSSGWLDAVDGAINRNTALRDGSRGHKLVIQQTVTDAPGGDAEYHLHVDDGSVRIHPGKADRSDVSFVTDYATAIAVNSGADSAQAAFMRGRLRLGGDVAMLVRNSELLSLVDDVFSQVRADTSY